MVTCNIKFICLKSFVDTTLQYVGQPRGGCRIYVDGCILKIITLCACAVTKLSEIIYMLSQGISMVTCNIKFICLKSFVDTTLQYVGQPRGGCRIYVDGCILKIITLCACAVTKLSEIIYMLSQWFLKSFPRRMVLAT